LNFKLIAQKDSVRIQLRYNYQESFAVQIGGKTVDELEFSDTLQAVPALTGSYCGENKFKPVANVL